MEEAAFLNPYIWSWLNTSAYDGKIQDSTTAIATPPNSTELIETSRPPKRKVSSQTDMNDLPRKRQQQEMMSPPDPPASVPDLSARSILSPKSQSRQSSPSRTSSPTKLLNTLRSSNPAIDCAEEDDTAMPQYAEDLRSRLADEFGEAVIPIALKAELEQAIPLRFKDIPNYAFSHDFRSPEEVDRLWKEAQRIHLEAQECGTCGKDENAWAQEVTRRVLGWGIPASGRDFLQLESLQSQAIDHFFLPVSPQMSAINKKVDFALVYSPRDPTTKSICDRQERAGGTLSQMTDTWTSRLVMAAGAEVKAGRGDGDEALAQLAIWLAAGFTKLRQLQKQVALRAVLSLPSPQQSDVVPTFPAQVQSLSLREVSAAEALSQPEKRFSTPPALPPMVGWVAIGHEWRTYIAYDIVDQEGARTCKIVGPIAKLSTTTRNFYDIFKLLDLITRTRTYLREVSWPSLHDNILLPLVSS
ncbi:MAG: hypothetical protein Q9166_005143 [cf. Caloplaca sp. 2 TL-2023]